MSSFMIPWKKKSETSMQIEPDVAEKDKVVRETAELAITENGDLSGKVIPERPEPEIPENNEIPKEPGEDERNNFLEYFQNMIKSDDISVDLLKETGDLIKILIAIHRFISISSKGAVINNITINVNDPTKSIIIKNHLKIFMDHELFHVFVFKDGEFCNILNVNKQHITKNIFEKIINMVCDTYVNFIVFNINDMTDRELSGIPIKELMKISRERDRKFEAIERMYRRHKI